MHLPRIPQHVSVVIALSSLLLTGFVSAAAPPPTAHMHLDCVERFHAGAHQRDLAGWSLANVGDITGNGRADIAIGAPIARPNGPQSGAVHVLAGSAPGDLQQTPLIFHGEDATDQAGHSVAAAGDVNGDGHDDILIGARYADRNPGEHWGAAYLFHGPRTGTLSLSNADAIIYGSSIGRLGSSVAGVGDVNGDGYDDVLVSAPATSAPLTGQGAIHLFLGPLSGTLLPADADATFLGEHAMDLAGDSVTGLGDINGNGFDDFAIGAAQHGQARGAVYIIHGRPTWNGTVSLGTADHKIVGTNPDDWFGFAVAGPGDVTGDGVPDLAVGAVRDDTTAADAGSVYVFASPLVATNASHATAAIHGHSMADEFGVAVAGVGDVTGNGVGDLAVGAPAARFDGARPGAAYVYAGGATLSGTRGAEDAAIIVRGINHGDAAGRSLAGNLDLDQDGHIDLYVGAPGYEQDPNVDNIGLVIGLDLDDLVDTDGDGLTDACEINRYGTDPLDADTDGDGLSDGDEVFVYGTDPLDADTDGDLFSDGAEVAAGSDPNNPLSVPTPAGPVTAPGPQLLSSTPLDDLDPLI